MLLTRKLSNFVHISPRRNAISFGNTFFSTLNVKPSLEATEDQPIGDGFVIKQLHQSVFSSSDNENYLNVRSGSYVEVSPEILGKYIPEGLSSDIKDEFKFAHKNMWMVRDSSKFVCKIIDHFGEKLKGGVKIEKNVSEITQCSVPAQFSNRPEWDNAQLACSIFGKEIGKEHKDDVDKYFKSLKEKDIPNKVMLTGPRGVGKSTILSQAVVHARLNGWLCLFIPNGWDHVQSGPYIEPVSGKEKVYDNPIMTTEALRGFWMAHKAQLKQLPIQKVEALEKYKPVLKDFKEAWNRALSLQGRSELSFIEMRSIIKGDDHYPESDSKDAPLLKAFDFLHFSPTTLEDYVLLGVALPEVAGAAFSDLVSELRILESLPVLIAVDQYNTWCVNSAFSYEYEPVVGHQIAVPNALRFIGNNKSSTDEWEMKNGLCIAATSFKHNEGGKVTFENAKHLLPLRVRVPVYNQTEYLSALSYYINNFAVDSTITLEDYLEYRIYSGSNPRLMRTESIPFFFPRSVWANRHEFRLEMLNSLSNGSVTEDDDEANVDEDDDDDDDSDDGSEGDNTNEKQNKSKKPLKK